MVNSIFSLELLALTKIAIHICSDPDIKAFQYRKRNSLRFVPAKRWESVMKKKLSSLNLPLKHEKKVIALMQPLSAQIDQWVMDHFSILKYCMFEQLIEFVWKDNGTIDRLKTAKSYIQRENNILFLRFQMACVYWLEDEAKRLWEKMPETSRRRLAAFDGCSVSSQWKWVVNDWIKIIKSGEVDWRKHRFSLPLVWYCQDRVVIQGNLLQQLSPQDQLNVFKMMMKEHIPQQTRTFCLSKMSAEHFEVMIKKEPVHVLKGLCNWPFHRQFQEMTDRIFPLLTKKEFRQFVLEVICDKIARNWRDYDYGELLKEVWNKSPVHFKEYVESFEFFGTQKMALNLDYENPFRD
ncbi:uncharacterized protein NPIL_356721 [Nephila pilipes]|uniref:Uncharacterized protein n=1 Tax=Nephila pilipes TaxID=299642 RepID=A0A8X6TFX5_NEPPI|nr:uncharacterized protein NPIL_356721 [Nephila pilipes]